MNLAFLDLTAFVESSTHGWLPAADAAIKASVLLLAATAASIALRRRSAALRHLIWTLALGSALAVPAVSLVVPRWQLPVVTVAPAQEVGPSTTHSRAAAQVQSAPRRRADAPPSSVRSPMVQPVLRIAPPATRPSAVLPDLSWPVLLAGIWIVGTLGILGHLFLGLAAVQWMSRRTERVTDAPWLPLAQELAAEIGIRRSPTFLRSPRATMPMAWGIFRPSVLMPAEADAWPADRLRIVLLHELAHVKRRDCLTHALAQIACAVYWFNPLAWIAARHLRKERERACDDLVLACGTRGSDYAAQLLEVARAMRSGRFPVLLTGATLAMAHRSQLEGRLMAILDTTVPRDGLSARRRGAATALAVCALVPLASLQPWAYGSAEPATAAESPVVKTAVSRPSTTPSKAARSTKPSQPAATASTRVTNGPAAQLAQDRRDHAGAVATAVANGVHLAIAGAVDALVESLAVQQVEPRKETRRDDSRKNGRKPVDPALVAALASALKDVDKGVREAAMHALAQLRDPAVFDPLVEALGDSAADVREQAAFALGQLRDPRAIEPLRAAMKDSNAGVREQTVFALGQLRDPTTVDALIPALRDTSADVREQAAFALGQLRDARAVEPLISALKDADADVREQAAFALGQLSDRAAVEALVIALRDSVADVREQVAFALGQLRDPRAMEALTSALKDQSASVREQAAFALGQLAR